MNQLQITELNGQRVLTTQQIAEGYGTTPRVISNNFNRNKGRFQEGKHFILLEGEHLKSFLSESSNLGIAKNVNKLYLWTEKGALLHAKSLGTDQAWDMYDILVDTYFKVKEQLLPQTPEDQIALLAKGSVNLNKKVDAIQDQVEDIREHFGLPAVQAAVLSSTRNIRIVHILGGKNSPAYKAMSRKVFSEFGRDFKKYFELPRYDALPLSRFDEAIRYTKSWKPSTNTALEIQAWNSEEDVIA
ncbi:ORF6C domain-containing protein [Lactococcus garvieae]|uniref:ORF6C domain-containing protein n=1 Tax=Lactococcus garvieae TaxID=1363 RepID=UPI001F61020C|nr:ORF6C domain-containing protein [Lactococcus garvieae]MCI3861101.1 ORF6C domain-containing protein [Lactococcus garvieae]